MYFILHAGSMGICLIPEGDKLYDSMGGRLMRAIVGE